MPDLCLVGYTYRGYPMQYALDRAQEFGYSAIELRDFQDINLSTPAALARSLANAEPAARAHGLRIASVFYGPLPIPRAGDRAAEASAFAEAIGVLADHGVPILHTRLSLRGNANRELISARASEEDYRLVRAALSSLLVVAEHHGVRIALEAHMGTLHDSAASLLRVISGNDSPYLTAGLDFANLLIANPNEDLAALPQVFTGRIGYVHLKNVKLFGQGYDWNLPLRWGDINYHRVLSALKQAGYQGPLAVEYCGSGDPDVFARDDADYLRELAQRLSLP
jgi:sugar phosphate isomerase/epimerase